METEVHGAGSSGGIKKKLALGLTLTMVALCTGKSMAGDLSAVPTQGVNAVGTTPAALPVTRAAASVLPDVSAGGASAESAWLGGFHVSGFLSQTFGIWQNPSALRQFTDSRNNLSVSRTWLQVDENYRLNENNNFFMREWFVYEPPYAFNSANGIGQHTNEFYNQYTIRDAWWENKTGPLTTHIGNQIVVWGQSLAFRVGDVINPQDTTWAFGFANLEQSRIPQWMVHPILNLPEFGPFSSNFIEGILIPRLQPMWNSCDYGDHRYDGECNVNAGSVNNGFPSASHAPSARFDVHYPNQFAAGRTALAPGFSVFGPFGQPGSPGLIDEPFSREFFYCSDLGSGSQPHNPVPKRLQRPCIPHFGPGGAVSIGQYKVPATTVANWEEGIRLHTLVGPAELTAFYFNTWDYLASIYWQAYTNQWRFKFAPQQYVGVTADMPIPMPSSLSEYLPFVGRAEMVYANHQPFTDFNPYRTSTIRYSDTVNTMVALDMDQAYAPWLTSTGNVSANVEVEDYITLDANQSMQGGSAPFGGVGGAIHENVNKNEVSALFNIGTGFWWEDIQPTWTMIFNPKGRTFLLFPSLVLNPPWTKNYFMKLQAIEVLGGDMHSFGGGLFKGESMLTVQFQYNFNLL